MRKDKRKCARKSVSIETRIDVNGHIYEGKIINISVDGAFIETTIKCSTGEEIVVTFDTPVFGVEERTALIKRIISKGIAVEFKFPSNNHNPSQAKK